MAYYDLGRCIICRRPLEEAQLRGRPRRCCTDPVCQTYRKLRNAEAFRRRRGARDRQAMFLEGIANLKPTRGVDL